MNRGHSTLHPARNRKGKGELLLILNGYRLLSGALEQREEDTTSNQSETSANSDKQTAKDNGGEQQTDNGAQKRRNRDEETCS